MTDKIKIARLDARFDARQFAYDSMHYRQAQRLSRAKLAKIIGQTQYIVTAYELQRSVPSLETVVYVCALMDKSINEYFKA